MSPVFTSGKLKSMLKLMDNSLDNMIKYLNKEVKVNPIVDMRPVWQCFTMDSIGSCAFGVDLNCFEDRENPIFVAAKQTFSEFIVSSPGQSLQVNMELGMIGLEDYFDFVTPG